ncbi:hypothetical protein BKM04_02730 [Pseudomonas syringae pv. syringae]|nr:hypothetical protein BKM04_02730 [Pseudomonas syringae pv. syringae]POD67764.1 hypothetical protein BKM06_02730 [Pseudomonas syringae pv. syringae]
MIGGRLQPGAALTKEHGKRNGLQGQYLEYRTSLDTAAAKDIGFVHPGQKVTVKVETFTFTKYGTVSGEVMSVSNDAIEDEKRGLIYSTKPRME